MPACHERGETRITWRDRKDGFFESVHFTPGFSCPVKGPEAHGKHGMSITWALRGHEGATTFQISTDWVPGELTDMSYARLFPMATDLGCHSRCPLVAHSDEPPMEDCRILNGPCWYDGSGDLDSADRLLQLFLVWGEQVVWDELEKFYHETWEVWPA